MSSNEQFDKHDTQTQVSGWKRPKISNYKKYRHNKKKQRQMAKPSKLKSYSIDHGREMHNWKLLVSKEYLSNKYNLLRLAILIVALILLFICILYGVGSVITLKLDDFWCSNPYSWNEIAQYNRENNNSRGVGGCYTADALEFDPNKVFATGSNESALVPKPVITVSAVFKSVTYAMICIVIVWILIKYILICLQDCRKTVNNEWYDMFSKVVVNLLLYLQS